MIKYNYLLTYTIVRRLLPVIKQKVLDLVFNDRVLVLVSEKRSWWQHCYKYIKNGKKNFLPLKVNHTSTPVYLNKLLLLTRLLHCIPGLERDVLMSRKGTFGTHLCPDLQKAVPVGTEGITCDFPVSSIL